LLGSSPPDPRECLNTNTCSSVRPPRDNHSDSAYTQIRGWTLPAIVVHWLVYQARSEESDFFCVSARLILRSRLDSLFASDLHAVDDSEPTSLDAGVQAHKGEQEASLR